MWQRTVTYEDGIVKYEKKVKGTIECDKRTVICEVGTAQCENETVKYEEKSKGTTKCEKRTVTCDVRTAKCEDGIVKCKKKVREPPNMTKELSHVMLELHNVRMEPASVRKK